MTRVNVAASAVVLALYLIGAFTMARHTFWSPDEGAKLMQARAVRFDDGIHYVLPYRGAWLDPDLRFYASRRDNYAGAFVFPAPDGDGGVRFHWPMWFPLLSLVPLTLFGISGAYVLPIFAGWLTALLSGALAAVIEPRLRAPAILIVGIGSPVYFYSLSFWEHTLATALGVLGVLLFVRGRGTLAAVLASSPFLLLALLLRLEMAALVVAVVAAGVVCGLVHRADAVGPEDRGILSSRWSRVFAATATIALLALFAATVLERHGARLGRIGRVFDKLGVAPSALVEIFVSAESGSGPRLDPQWLALGTAGVVACLVAAFIRWKKIEGLVTVLGMSALLAFSVNLLTMSQGYRALHGVLGAAPFMIFAAYAVRPAWQQPRAPLFALAVLAFFYLVAGTGALLFNSVDSAGLLTQALQWGQRYLLTLYPVLLVLAVAGLYEYCRSGRSRLQKAVVVLLSGSLIGSGFLLERRGVDEAVRTRRVLAAWQRELEGVGPVVTDIWWIPAALADLYTRQEIFVLRNRNEIGEWAELARAAGVREFTFASVDGVPRSRPFRSRGIAFDRESPRVIEGLYVARFELTP